MDYEKKYNKALEKAKRLYEGKDKAPEEPILEYLFPELREGEDEKVRKQLISICDEWLGGGYSARPCLNDIKWLKNLLEKQEQKPAEWSEEDEKFFTTALWHISYSVSNGKSVDCRCDTTEWLKSIKERIKSLRPSWKPSKEQMLVLGRFLNFLHEIGSPDFGLMDSLLGHLKEF